MKLYRVDDVLSDYADIGGYYIFAENLSDLGKILKDIRFHHYYNDEKGRETLQKKEIDMLQNVKDSAIHDHRLDMRTISVTEFAIKPGLVDTYENGD